MKVTVYELLGKIKDNEAPKKIRYKYGYLYKDFLFDGETSNYISGKDWLFGEDITAMLNDEVEIIEEDKKIEKIKNINCESFRDTHNGIRQLTDVEIALDIITLKEWINKVIDKLNKEYR